MHYARWHKRGTTDAVPRGTPAPKERPWVRKRTPKAPKPKGSGLGDNSKPRSPIPYLLEKTPWVHPVALAEEMAMAHSPDALKYEGSTGLTRETIRNAVRCPRCSSGATFKCLYRSTGGDYARFRERSTLHKERVEAALEKLWDTREVRVRRLEQSEPGAETRNR